MGLRISRGLVNIQEGRTGIDNSMSDAFYDPSETKLAFGLLMLIAILLIVDLKKDEDWEIFFHEHVALISLIVPIGVMLLVMTYFHEEISKNWKLRYNQLVTVLDTYLFFFIGFALTNDHLYENVFTNPLATSILAVLVLIAVWGKYTDDTWMGWFNGWFRSGQHMGGFAVGRRLGRFPIN